MKKLLAMFFGVVVHHLIFGLNPLVPCKNGGIGSLTSMIFRLKCVKLSKCELEVAAMMLNKIWDKCNKYIFQQIFVSPRRVATETLQEKMDFQQAQMSQLRGCANPVMDRSLVKWIKPSILVYKANWCSVIDRKNNTLGYGIVIRDSNNDVSTALCSSEGFSDSAYVADIRILWRAVLFVRI